MLRPLALAALAIFSLSASADEKAVELFDGKSLAGWDGDPTYWRVEGGCIVDEVRRAHTSGTANPSIRGR